MKLVYNFNNNIKNVWFYYKLLSGMFLVLCRSNSSIGIKSALSWENASKEI